MDERLTQRLANLGVEVVDGQPQWSNVTKARSTPEALAEDAVIDFLVSEGWQRHTDDDNLFGHAERSPGVWLTLAEAFAVEQASNV